MKRIILFILLTLPWFCICESSEPAGPIDQGIDGAIDILCISSSWGVNTWYYLPFMLKDAGISFRLHGLYRGAATFQTWCNMFDGEEIPQLFQWRFYNDSNRHDLHYMDINTTKGYLSKDIHDTRYDLIITNLGAAASVQPNMWNNMSDEFITLLRGLLKEDGYIVYNSTWSPSCHGLDVISGNNGWVANNQTSIQYGVHDKESQAHFQDTNWQLTQQWCTKHNITHIVPNGSLMYMLRNDTTINTGEFTIPAWNQIPIYKDYHEGDDLSFTHKDSCYHTHIENYELCIDGVHAAAGLPSFALTLNLFATIFSPIYGVTIEEINWRPTSIKTRLQSYSNENYLPSFATEGKINMITDFYISLSEQQVETIIQYIHIAQQHPFERYHNGAVVPSGNISKKVLEDGQILIYRADLGLTYNIEGQTVNKTHL